VSDARYRRDAGFMEDYLRTGMDRSALADLYPRYTPFIFALARRWGLDHHSAEEVVQNVWIRYLRKSEAFAALSTPYAWFRVMTRSEVHDLVRRQRRLLPLLPEHDSETAEGLPEPEALRTERAAKVGRAFRQLSPRCQELLRIAIVDGDVTYGEIAGRLGMSPGSVGPARNRCLNHLRKLMAEDEDEDEDLELSPRRAVVRVHTSAEVGESADVDFSFIAPTRNRWVDGSVEAPLAHPMLLRVLLHAVDAAVHPVTQTVELAVDRTCAPVRFRVVPAQEGALELVFRVYLRDGQLLQEVRADLPVGEA
jgi:RNA polymerase sigma factor (sigma-70 family)